MDLMAAHSVAAHAVAYSTAADAVASREPVSEPRFGRSVSIDQAASLLNLSRRTVYNRIRDGRLQTIRTLGGSQRVLVESLYELGFRPQAFSTSASAVTFAVRPARTLHSA